MNDTPPPTGRQLMDEAASALAQGEFDRAVAMAEKVLAGNPENPRALRIGLQSLASIGDAKAVIALLNKIGSSGHPRREGIRFAMRAAKKAGKLDCGVALARRLAGVQNNDPALFAEITELMLSTEDASIVEEYVGSLSVPANQTVVKSLWAAKSCLLPEALQLLDTVPQAHALRLRAVRAVQDLARRQLNQAVIHRMGMELIEAGNGMTVPPWLTWHAATIEGYLDDAKRVFERGERTSAVIFEDEDEFKRHWHAAAQWYLNTFNVESGMRAISMAFERGLTTEADHPTRNEVADFVAEFAQELSAAQAMMRALTFNEPLGFPDDELVRIVSRPKIVNIGNFKNAETDIGWLRLVTEVARQVRAAGGAISFVHEAHKGLAEQRSYVPLALCYHTHGLTPGTLHFKEADLPRFYSVDEKGYSGWSSLAVQPVEELALEDLPADRVETFFEEMRQKTLAANYSKYEQSAISASKSLPERFVFVALQIIGDRVQELARVPMLEMLNIVVRRFAGTEYKVVVKRHPLCRDRRVKTMLDELGASGQIILREDSIHDLIARSAAVITGNSGVGSETAIHLKPIYIFSEAEYGPIAHNVRDEADFIAKTDPIRLAVSADTIKRFVYFYRNRFLLDVNEPELLRTAIRERIVQPALACRNGHVEPYLKKACLSASAGSAG
jgi:hypothetical protein